MIAFLQLGMDRAYDFSNFQLNNWISDIRPNTELSINAGYWISVKCQTDYSDTRIQGYQIKNVGYPVHPCTQGPTYLVILLPCPLSLSVPCSSHSDIPELRTKCRKKF